MTASPGSQATSSAGPPIKSRRRELPRTRPALLRSPRQKKGTRGPRHLLPCLVAMHGPRLQKMRRMTVAAPGPHPPPPVARLRGRMHRRSSSLTIGQRPSMVLMLPQARVHLPTIRVSSSPTSSPTRGMALVLGRASSDNMDSQASSVRMASLARMPVRTPRVADPPARGPTCPSELAAPTVGPVLPTMPTAA